MTGIPNQFGDIDPIVPNFGDVPDAAVATVPEASGGQTPPVTPDTRAAAPAASGPR